MKYWLVGVALLVLGSVSGWLVGNNNTNPSSAAPAMTTESVKAMTLNQDMRKLWEDHITWTRLYIVDAVNSLPEKDASLARLMQNQVDIGNLFKTYYGNAAGNKLTDLLKEHIKLAGDVVQAAAINDQAALNTANTAWQSNADQVAALWASLNPKWSKTDLQAMMKSHLDLTKQEAVDIIGHNSVASITDYDKVHAEILEMADTLSDGIARQYPDKF